jgi:hypothetical protein
MEVIMKAKKIRTTTETYQMEVDGKPVTVKATPYQIHTSEKRYRVSINNSPVHIFAWDDNSRRLVLIDKAATADKVPERIEEAIGRQLYNKMAA